MIITGQSHRLHATSRRLNTFCTPQRKSTLTPTPNQTPIPKPTQSSKRPHTTKVNTNMPSPQIATNLTDSEIEDRSPLHKGRLRPQPKDIQYLKSPRAINTSTDNNWHTRYNTVQLNGYKQTPHLDTFISELMAIEIDTPHGPIIINTSSTPHTDTTSTKQVFISYCNTEKQHK